MSRPYLEGAYAPVHQEITADGMRYLPLEELGRGGMGVVLRAYDPKLRREVALKVLRPVVFDATTRQRMIREARAMARLSHPNVIEVFDVEITASKANGSSAPGAGVVIAMEYVAGPTLRAWLRSEPRGWHEILDMFVQAGRGLAAAHSQGILHRDFKPTNVLVGQDDRCRVADFGLARSVESTTLASSQGVGATDPPARADDESRDLTRSGAVVGTYRYMAPEQHLGSAVGPAADQFSFCVALWEALTGAYPFEGPLAVSKRKGPLPWPKGNHVPRRVALALRRGLSPSPQERWPSMSDLLDPLVFDRAATRRRLIRAGAVTTVAGVVGFSAVVAGGGRQPCSGARADLATVWNPEVAEAVEHAMSAADWTYAAESWTRVRPRIDAYADEWVDGHTEACSATTIHGEQSEADMDLRMRCLRGARDELQAAVNVLQQVDDALLDRVEDVVDGLPLLERCNDLSALAAEQPAPAAAEEEAVSQTRRLLADSRAARRAGRYQAARELAAAARSRLEELRYEPIRAEVWRALGEAASGQGKYEEASAALGEALRLALRNGQWTLASEVSIELATSTGTTAARPGEGLAFARTGAGLAARGSDAGRDVRLRQAVGGALRARGDLRQAERELRLALATSIRELGEASSSTASARNQLGGVLYDSGKLEEAEALARAALARWEETLGPNHPTSAGQRSRIAVLLKAQGKLEQAEAQQLAALSSLEETLGPSHPRVAYSRANLASVYYSRRRFPEAEREYRRALATLVEVHGPSHPSIAAMRGNLGAVLDSQGKLEQAAQQIRTALDVYERRLGSEHPDVAGVRLNLGGLLVKMDKGDAAEGHYRTALAVLRRTLPVGHANRVHAQASLGDLLARQGRYAEASSHLDRAWGSMRDQQPSVMRSRVASALARLRWATQGERDEPRALAEEARAFFARHPEVLARDLAEVEALLKTL